jgi:S-adenosylmethionine/arginine decarboxylase-like enzyme
MYNRTKGYQVVLDFVWDQNTLNNQQLLLSIFYILKESIKKTSLMIVEESSVLLPVLPHKSEEGGTIFFQLDSSHISAHLYYVSKLLAIDIFGCGFTDIERVALEITDKLKEIIPSIKVSYRNSFNRFHY